MTCYRCVSGLPHNWDEKRQHMIKVWERPKVKGSTHEQALDIANGTGLKLWAVYAAAMNCYQDKLNPSELGDNMSHGGELTHENKY